MNDLIKAFIQIFIVYLMIEKAGNLRNREPVSFLISGQQQLCTIS